MNALPYIHASGREFVQQASGFDNEQGVIHEELGGEHALWAARVPFLPALMSDDFTGSGKQRIELVMRRQFRFIYDLSRARGDRATFELRFIATPGNVPGQPNTIDIAFFGKVFSPRHEGWKEPALQLWERFSSTYPLEDPYNYPLEPVVDREDFLRLYEPFALEQLPPSNLIEVRKFEDMPIASGSAVGRLARAGDYIAHPFVPSSSFSPMNRFFQALAFQSQRCFASVSIRPVRLFDQEIHNVSFAIGQFKRIVAEDSDITEEYVRARSVIGVGVYKQLMEEREHLMTVRVHVVGETSTPHGLTEALGSELMDNAHNPYPTQWVGVQPADGVELHTALNNLRWLEHDFWGQSKASPALARLRYLASAKEASGAFRLPVPPESGYMPGVLVKSEPFVSPADALEQRRQTTAGQGSIPAGAVTASPEKEIRLGEIYHRGNPTSQFFTTPLSSLTRHGLIAGSTGSGKTTTILYLLDQLWRDHRVPFLVLYPVDKPEYRGLLARPSLSRDLLYFTLGDERTAPFRFNPFEVPEGLLVKTHLSRLMRVFTAAFTLYDPLPMVYREALRKVYRDKGWDPVNDLGQRDREYPVMSEYYQAISDVTSSLHYGREVQDNVRQMSVIRIGDLLENAGHVVNVRRSMSIQTLLSRPAVMELASVGSTQDIALLMGFLLMRFAEEVERNPRPKDRPHITVVEEAHRLMAESSSHHEDTGHPESAAGEDFGSLLAEVRGYGEGILIAEQIPTLLVKGAIGNTYLKIMHWLEDAPSFELFGDIMNLNEVQRDYARSLHPGHAIVRSPFGRPVHIKVPDITQGGGQDEAVDLSNERIRAHMVGQQQALKLEDVKLVTWEGGLEAAEGGRPEAAPVRTIASRLLHAPMRACAYCQPLLDEGQCPYKEDVVPYLAQTEQNRQWAAALARAVAIEGEAERKRAVRAMVDRLAPWSAGQVYCYLAHQAEIAWKGLETGSESYRAAREHYGRLLREFSGMAQGG